MSETRKAFKDYEIRHGYEKAVEAERIYRYCKQRASEDRREFAERVDAIQDLDFSYHMMHEFGNGG